MDPTLADILQQVAVGVLRPEDAAVQLSQLAGAAANNKQVGLSFCLLQSAVSSMQCTACSVQSAAQGQAKRAGCVVPTCFRGRAALCTRFRMHTLSPSTSQPAHVGSSVATVEVRCCSRPALPEAAGEPSPGSATSPAPPTCSLPQQATNVDLASLAKAEFPEVVWGELGVPSCSCMHEQGGGGQVSGCSVGGRVGEWARWTAAEVRCS